MPITDYTTYAEVRSALGVSSTELPDTVVAQPQWNTVLTLELEEVAEGLPTLYTTISAIPSVSRTTQQTRLYDLTRLFSALSLGKNFLASMPMFSVQRLTDGRAEFERAADIHADTRDAVYGLYNNIKKKLASVYAILEPTGTVYTPVTPVLVSGVPLGTDPVTTTVA